MPKSGFVFVELYTQRISEYASFFQRVCGFKLIRDEGDFAELRSTIGLVLLNADKVLPEGHPFQDKLPGHGQGIGVEIGIVLSDLPLAHAAATEFAGWTVTAMQRQEWGMTDFRVATPDGYYLRLTEPFE